MLNLFSKQVSCTCLIRNLLFDTVKYWNFKAWLDIFTICWKWHFFWKIIGASPRIKLLKNFPKEKWNLLLVLFIVYQTADIGLTEKVRGDECRFEISVQRKNESYIMQVRNLRWWNMNTLVVCFLSILLCFLCHTDKKFEVANNWTIFTWNVSVTFLTL